MGYLGNGLTITGTQNSKRIVVDATPNQTISTVTGGYLTGQLDVYRNGVKLVDTQDYTASDGASVTFLNAVSEGDELEFVVFENFDVANALAKEGGTVNGSLLVSTASTFSSDLTVDGNVTIGGTLTYEDVTNIDSVGIITARSFVSIADSIVHTGDENTSIRFPAADTFTVETAGSERVRVDSSGRVGVGTNNPLDELHVNSSSANVNLRLTRDLNTGARITGSDGASPAFIVETIASGTATERLHINSDGEVGIGTNNPTETLTLNHDNGASIGLEFSGTEHGTINVNSAAMYVRAGTGKHLILGSDGTEKLRITSGGLVGINTNTAERNLVVSGGASEGVIQITNNTSGSSQANGFELIHFTSGETQLLNRENNAMRFDTNNTERLRITAAGDVGIGTATVRNGLKLDVEGAIGATAGSTANVSFANFDDPNSGMYFPTADQVGLVAGGSRKLLVGSTGLTLNNGDLTLNNNDILGTGGINITGIVTATSYRGDGSQLSGVSAGVTTHVGTASGIVTSVFLGDATDHKVTVTGFVTFTATQAGTEGESHTIRIVNSGIATVGFSTYFLFPSGAAPVLPTADGAVSLISFTVHDSVGAGCTQLLAGASVNFS